MQTLLTRAITRLRQMDWRIFMGAFLTGLWLIAGFVYLSGGSLAKATIYDIPLEHLGSFLEGAFAPLAFLWLVIGLFIQQKELSDNTEVLRQTSIQSEKQTQAIAATEMNARQETFFTIAKNVKGQLGGIAGMLFISSMGESEGGTVSKERLAEMWQRLASGDDMIFSREFLLIDEDEYGGYGVLFYETEIRRRHTKNFMRTFDRLIAMAKNCDDANGIIADSLTQTAHGLIYNRMRNAQPDELKEAWAPVDTANHEEASASTQR